MRRSSRQRTGILAACIFQTAFPRLSSQSVLGYFPKPGHIRVSVASVALTDYALPSEVTFEVGAGVHLRFSLRWDISKSTDTTVRAHYYLRGPDLHPFLRNPDFREWMQAQLRERGWKLCTYHIQHDEVKLIKHTFDLLTGWAAITLTKVGEHASRPPQFTLRRVVEDGVGRPAPLAVDFSRIPADAHVPSYGCVRAARPVDVAGAAAAVLAAPARAEPTALAGAAPAARPRAAPAAPAPARAPLAALADAASAAPASVVPAAPTPVVSAALAQAAARVTPLSFATGVASKVARVTSWLFGSANTNVKTASASVKATARQTLVPVPRTHRTAIVVADSPAPQDGGVPIVADSLLSRWARPVAPAQAGARPVAPAQAGASGENTRNTRDFPTLAAAANARVPKHSRRGDSVPTQNADATAAAAASSAPSQSASAVTAAPATSSSSDDCAAVAASPSSDGAAGVSRDASASPQAQPVAKRPKLFESPPTPVRGNTPAVAPALAHDGAAESAPAHEDAAVLAPADTSVGAAASSVDEAREETAAQVGTDDVPPGDAAARTPGNGRGEVPVLSSGGDATASVANADAAVEPASPLPASSDELPPDILCQ